MMVVSIHALLAECDPCEPCNAVHVFGFNPRTPCGVRQSSGVNGRESTMFQSTHSLRSATRIPLCRLLFPGVSIHALLAECDLLHPPLLSHPRRFNPRTPCGVRPAPEPLKRSWKLFQSTHSLRSATVTAVWSILPTGVSIHALLAECDAARRR